MNERDLLDKRVLPIINDSENSLYISTISIQEAIHLYHVGKVKGKWKTANDILKSIAELDISIIPVKREHLLTFASLVISSGHNDPNDHVIISQAISEKIPVISSDRQFEHYRDQKLDFIFNKKK
jgi:PIN domain nuclease of toxin-antitoxin system